MATTLAGPAPSTEGPSRAHARLGLGRVLRSEWTKFRSVRSTFWTLASTVVVIVGISVATGFGRLAHFHHLAPQRRARELVGFDPTSLSLRGIFLAQLTIGVLGVLVIASEYGTGMIRATFAAVPRRGLVLAAKAIVLALAALVVGLASSFIAFFVGQTILAGDALQASIGQPGVLRAVIGGGLYLTVLGLLAVGLGAIIRSTAGGIAALVGLVIVIPGVTHALPQSWQYVLDKSLPSDTGQTIMNVTSQAHYLGPWAGFGVFCAWAAAIMAAAVVLTARRDA